MYALEIKNLCKTYGNGVNAVKDMNLTIEQGDFYALLGPNGAGKSTTIGMITTVVNISSGSIKIMGHDNAKEPSKAKTMLGAMPQEINLNIFETPWQILLNQAAYFGIAKRKSKARAKYLLEQADLWHKRNSQVRFLSGGMKRRLMIARALIHEPKLLILDEPTAGVDVELRNSMWEFLQGENKKGLTIILTTHYLEEAERLCNKIAIINHGQVVVNKNMKSLLKSLDEETLLLQLDKPLSALPDIGLAMQLQEEDMIKLTLHKDEDLSAVIAQLAQHDIKVHRVTSERSALENVFVNLIDKISGEKDGH